MTAPQPMMPEACRRIYYYANFAAHDLKEICNATHSLETIINAYKQGECDTTPGEGTDLGRSIHARVESARVELDDIDKALCELLTTLRELEESNQQ